MKLNRTYIFICLLGLMASTMLPAQKKKYQSKLLQYKITETFQRKEKALKQQFAEAGLQWPVQQMYIRSFKHDSQLEVWVSNSETEIFQLFKTYAVCAMSGKLGPKRKEGDYQVPEGVYYINEFKPNSDYHFALGINYPNEQDRHFSDANEPGSEIYIHGMCTTVGCIPIQNNAIEELYVLASIAKKQGQEFIPVHIFPIKFKSAKSAAVLEKATAADPLYKNFATNLKAVYDYFEEHHKLPLVGVTREGQYRVF